MVTDHDSPTPSYFPLVCLSVGLSVNLSICLSVCLSDFLSCVGETRAREEQKGLQIQALTAQLMASLSLEGQGNRQQTGR